MYTFLANQKPCSCIHYRMNYGNPPQLQTAQSMSTSLAFCSPAPFHGVSICVKRQHPPLGESMPMSKKAGVPALLSRRTVSPHGDCMSFQINALSMDRQGWGYGVHSQWGHVWLVCSHSLLPCIPSPQEGMYGLSNHPKALDMGPIH